MSAPWHPIAGESGGRRRSTGLVVAAVLVALPSLLLAQTRPPAPAATPRTPELEAALKTALAGDSKALLKMADGGDADAQYHAGELFLFGSSAVPKDPAKGCAYEEKASAKRADAMHLVGLCHQSGAAGAVDKAKAEAAYLRAAEMGFPKSKCTLGQMLMGDPAQAGRGMTLCKEAGNGGDLDAQLAVANAYFSGTTGKADKTQARKWYEMASKQNSIQATRRLGEMYANGDGGRKDTKKALELWVQAEKGGDPLVAILVADQMFSDMTGGKKPGPGTYQFRGRVPTGEIEVVQEWYRLAEARDPRPDIKERAKYALAILGSLNAGAAQVTKTNSAAPKAPPPKPPPPPKAPPPKSSPPKSAPVPPPSGAAAAAAPAPAP